jgi:hypothetical protein
VYIYKRAMRMTSSVISDNAAVLGERERVLSTNINQLINFKSVLKIICFTTARVCIDEPMYISIYIYRVRMGAGSILTMAHRSSATSP